MIIELAKFAASLVAILLLAWVAARMGLGGDVRIRDADHARLLAGEAVDGFEPVDIAIDRAGIGALMRDAAGRVLLIRRHGATFAARILDSHAHSRLDHNFLLVGSGEKQFGDVTLDLGDRAQVWASSLRRLGN